MPHLNANEARLEIQKLHALPPVSLVVRQFLEAVQDPKIEVRRLAAIIEQDPALLARMVGLANSAYYGYPEPVVTAEEAIFKVLGLNTAKNLALSIVLSGPLDAGRCHQFRLDRYWAQAMSVAIFAKRLAAFVAEESRPSPGDAYLGGLLHNIGLLALVHLFPEAMSEVLAEGECDPKALVERERQIIGTDHCDVGGWLARKWQLPPHIVAVLEHHLQQDYSGEHGPLVRLVNGALRWATHECTSEETPPDMSGLGVPAQQARSVGDYLRERREEITLLSRLLAYG